MTNTTQGFFASPQAFSSATDDWATPASYFKELQKEFNFVLDPAASSTNHKASAWYGLDHPDPARLDGLAADWAAEAQALNGVVWLNPPYGKTMKLWTAKAAAENAKGATVVLLLPARTDTKWFHEDCYKHELRFIKGRLKFGGSINSAPFPRGLGVMR
jgi:site-specific DNA-methyltransferase (adenine-specific)